MIITKTVKNISWAELKEAANAGTLRQLVASGDQIPVTLKNGEEIVLDVAHDKNGKTYFITHDCLNAEHRMNKDWTNKGGWAACEMREYLNSTVLALLPDEIQEVIAPTTIVQVLGRKRVECEDKLFLLSRTQVFGEGPYTAAEPEDTQIDIFTDPRNRIKMCGDYANYWWERSPSSGYTNSFCFVANNGTATNYYTANNTLGVGPGFCI